MYIIQCDETLIQIDLEALKARYVASEVNDDPEVDTASIEEQLALLESLDTRIGHAFGDVKERAIETVTAAYDVKEMDCDDTKGQLDFV
ncbi:hypothetical protein DPMN_180957 [Dreissena polymorpha]|uniref:Uncharacterized protein n=1 Tax=Dreissena polymorpha TaxID=45954 RepID=A0A9D4DBW7_DREPO|nr:hypothetical protein DPMN_180957 [Dreissena polymorpha]